MTRSEPVALIYTAGEDLWRAVDALDEAKANLRQAGRHGEAQEAEKAQEMAEGLAHKVELFADGVMARTVA